MTPEFWSYRVLASNMTGSGPWSAIGQITIPPASGGGECEPPICYDPESNPTEPPEEW